MMHNLPGNHTLDECIADCKKEREKMGTIVFGCEHKHGIECEIHNLPVARDNGRKGSTCCVFGMASTYLLSYIFIVEVFLL